MCRWLAAPTSIQAVQDIIGLGREVKDAALVQNAALYAAGNKVALAGASKWSDASSDPADDIKAGQDAVRRMIGRKPNILTIGLDVFRALTKHPKIKDQFKYTGSDSITETMLAKYFNLEEVIVGNAVALPDGADDATPAVDIWGNNAILSYRPRGSNMLVPAFGYTYGLTRFPAVGKLLLRAQPQELGLSPHRGVPALCDRCPAACCSRTRSEEADMARKQSDGGQDEAPRIYVVLSPVSLDGKLYRVGAEIRPGRGDGREMLGLGAIGGPPPPAKPQPDPPAT